MYIDAAHAVSRESGQCGIPCLRSVTSVEWQEQIDGSIYGSLSLSIYIHTYIYIYI